MKAQINVFPVVIGGFYMQRGTLVRVDREVKPGWFSIEYIRVGDDYVCPGGGSGAWQECDFQPITSPVLFAACMAREMQIQAARHKQQAEEAAKSEAVWLKAMQAIRETPATDAIAKAQGEKV